MNVYAVDLDPKRAAQQLPDRLVVVGVTQAAMLLQAANYAQGFTTRHIEPADEGHPWVLWMLECKGNWGWVRRYALALVKEREHRFGTESLFAEVLHRFTCAKIPLPNGPLPIDARVPCYVPNRYLLGYADDCYRAYVLGEHRHFAAWTNRAKPSWWTYEPVRRKLDQRVRCERTL